MICTSGLMTIRVPEELQAQMKRHKVNWSDKIRTYLELQIKQMELLRFLKKNESRMKRTRLHADSAEMIRSDRESR